MATGSSRLGVQERNDLLSDFERLFARCYKVFPFPIPVHDLPRMYNMLIDRPLRDTVSDMTRRGYPCHTWFEMHASMTVQLAGRRSLILHFGQPSSVFPMRDALLLKAFMLRPDARVLSYDDVEWAFGDHTHPLIEWASNYAQLVFECKQAWATCQEIIKLVKTAGQIRRMVPEMVQFLSPPRRAVVATQTRSSALHYDWAAYDRKRVFAMLQAMSKCWLMPPKEDGAPYPTMADSEPHERAAYA